MEGFTLKICRSVLLLRTMVSHIIYDAMAFIFFMMDGRGKEFVRAKVDELHGMRDVL